jgi:hypothetical protein
MNNRKQGPIWGIMLLSAAGVLCAGCGSGNTVESFVPEELTSRQAIEKALTAWKSGQADPGTLAGGKPKIQVADERWLQGAKLLNFEIGEPLDEDGPSQFPVKLTLEGASDPITETYVVVGKDPLWVYTKSEYERSGGM